MRGNGESGGQFTTLGIREHRDVYSIIHKLQKDYNAQEVFLYGRSMGAVAIMKFISVHNKSKGLIDRQKASCNKRDNSRFTISDSQEFLC